MGLFPLHVAILRINPVSRNDMVRRILNKGADINVKAVPVSLPCTGEIQGNTVNVLHVKYCKCITCEIREYYKCITCEIRRNTINVLH